MAYKLVAVDLDDTLLTKERRIDTRGKDSIKRAVQKDIKVVLCTGRTKKGAQRFYDELGLDSLFIVSGGAEIFDGSGNALYTRNVDTYIAKKLLVYAYDRSIPVNVYLDGELVFRERNSFTEAYEKKFGFPGIVMPDILDRDIVTPKVLFYVSEDMITDIQESVKKEFPMVSVVRSTKNFLEFSDPDVSKGNALKFVAKYYGIDRKDIIAIGDNEIDIPMIKFAGLGAAVANAEEGVRKIADIVCASNDDGGVADVIEKYILEA